MKSRLISGRFIKKAAVFSIICGLLGASLTGCASQGKGETDSDLAEVSETNEAGSDTNAADAAGSLDDSPAQDGTGVILPGGTAAPTGFLTPEAYAEADMWSTCDDAALAAVMKKAKAGEAVTIACIGGSITEGTVAKGSRDSEVGFPKGYAELFHQWWDDNFPDAAITFVNAGIGGTDSYLGVHRVYEDVLCYNPDLVLVEYAVNDGNNNTYKRTYENLVRKIMSYETSPAVMLLFMAQTNGSTAQSNQVLVGYNYKLPMVSYANAIDYYMSNNIYTAGELSGDTVHPSALGHAICGELLWTYLNNVYLQIDSYAEPDMELAGVLTKEIYMNACIADSNDIMPIELGTFTEANSTAHFPNGWECKEGEGGITFTATFRNLGILYINQISGNPGSFDIYVDGELVRTINARFENGWGNAITPLEVFTSDEEAEHEIVIKKAEGSAGDEFKLLGLMLS